MTEIKKLRDILSPNIYLGLKMLPFYVYLIDDILKGYHLLSYDKHKPNDEVKDLGIIKCVYVDSESQLCFDCENAIHFTDIDTAYSIIINNFFLAEEFNQKTDSDAVKLFAEVN